MFLTVTTEDDRIIPINARPSSHSQLTSFAVEDRALM